MAGFTFGKLWQAAKGDIVTVNGTKFKVEKVDSFDPEDNHEEKTKEIFLAPAQKGMEGEYLIELSDSLRSFYRIEQPDSFTNKKVEIPIENISPE